VLCIAGRMSGDIWLASQQVKECSGCLQLRKKAGFAHQFCRQSLVMLPSKLTYGPCPEKLHCCTVLQVLWHVCEWQAAW
jgi:hypothetical protein